MYIHRLICDVIDKPDIKVDHKDHNGLNNRMDNLRKSTVQENDRHRQGANKNSKSGFRNVYFNNEENRYIVQLQIDGKNRRLGKFKDVLEAANFAKQMREKYYGEYAGGG